MVAGRRCARLKVLGRTLRQDRIAALVDCRQCQLARPNFLGRERDGVAWFDHPGKPAVDPPQPSGATRRLGGDGGHDPHLEQAVRDDPGQPDRAGEVSVAMDRVVVAGRFRIRIDLRDAERDLALHTLHERMTKRARERQTLEPPSPVVRVSKVKKRMPQRLMSETTRPCEVTVSPGLGCRSHSISWSACSSFAKSTAASVSSKSWGAVTPNE